MQNICSHDYGTMFVIYFLHYCCLLTPFAHGRNPPFNLLALAKRFPDKMRMIH